MPYDPNRKTLTLALSLVGGFGGKTITRILARNDLLGRGVKEFVGLGSASLIEEYRIKPALAEKWTSGVSEHFARAQALEERLDRLGVGIMTAADAHYPQRLEEFDADPPGVLYHYGNQRLLGANTFAVMSSRNAPPVALETIDKLVEEGVLNGEVLIAGHNTPEYQRSAVVPLRWGAPRILVLDRELFDALGDDLKDEPFRAARLWRHQFDAQTDLAVSIVPPDRMPHAAANRKRDHLIAALAHRHDFPWIAAGGNMEKLARTAIQAGRKVRIVDAFPGSREWIRYGATVMDAPK